jgi:hypothetical protein
MIRIAILSEQIAAQLRTIGASRPPEMENLTVIWSGTSQNELKARGEQLKPQVLIIELALLSEPYQAQLDELLKATEAELILIPYSFARREVIKQLSSERTRTVKIPVSLGNLRLSILSLLVRDAFHSKSKDKPEPEPASSRSAAVLTPVARSKAPPPPSESAAASVPFGLPRMFTPTQLGRLQEFTSSVRCECTNHLAELCTSLAAFEEYSKQCHSANDADAALHAHLYREASRARHLMEEALLALCRHEGVEP